MSCTLPLTHFDSQGQARMVGVAAKDVTLRTAKATGCIAMQPATLALVRAGHPQKGDVLGDSAAVVGEPEGEVRMEGVGVVGIAVVE